MIVKCSGCGQDYDLTGYPAGYTFQCECGTVIQASSTTTPPGSSSPGSPHELASGEWPQSSSEGPWSAAAQANWTSEGSGEDWPAHTLDSRYAPDLDYRQGESTVAASSPQAPESTVAAPPPAAPDDTFYDDEEIDEAQDTLSLRPPPRARSDNLYSPPPSQPMNQEIFLSSVPDGPTDPQAAVSPFLHNEEENIDHTLSTEEGKATFDDYAYGEEKTSISAYPTPPQHSNEPTARFTHRETPEGAPVRIDPESAVDPLPSDTFRTSRQQVLQAQQQAQQRQSPPGGYNAPYASGATPLHASTSGTGYASVPGPPPPSSAGYPPSPPDAGPALHPMSSPPSATDAGALTEETAVTSRPEKMPAPQTPQADPYDEDTEFVRHDLVEDGSPGEVSMITATPARSSPLAVLTFLLSLLPGVGVLAVLFGPIARNRIRRNPLLRGKLLAGLATLLGLFWLLAMLAVVAASFFLEEDQLSRLAQHVPQLQVLLQRTSLPSPLERQLANDSLKLPPDRLHPMIARQLLQKFFASDKRFSNLQIANLYVYQKPHTHHAYAHWNRPNQKTSSRSLFHRSNQGRWYLSVYDLGQGYDIRSSLPGPPRLTASLARQIIQKFWKIEGGFHYVRVDRLYVHQEKGAHRAHVYWKQLKHPPNKPLRAWLLKSIFHRSNRGEWYLSRYYGGDEDPGHSLKYHRQGSRLLSASLARQLLEEHYQDQEKKLDAQGFLVHQPRKQNIAYVYWQVRPPASPQRSTFYRSNRGDWYLVALSSPPATLPQHLTKGPPRLSRNIAEQILRLHLRSTRQRAQVRHFYIYQPPQKRQAYVCWRQHQQEKDKNFHSLFLYTNSGRWFFSRKTLSSPCDPRFKYSHSPRLQPDEASRIIQLFWNEDERFAGSRVEQIYVYQPPIGLDAWAHWRLVKKERSFRIRSSFHRSNSGEWYLGVYDIGKGYHVRYHQKGQKRLQPSTARQILQRFLRKKGKKPQIGRLYVYQEPQQNKAYVHWIRSHLGEQTPTRSLFHRSNKGEWYLSTYKEDIAYPLRFSYP